MNLLGRLTETIATKVNALLDRFDEPGEALDYAYQLELEQLLRVRRSVMDVASSQQHLEVEAEQLRQAASGLEARAREELSIGREDNAREASARRTVIERGLASIVTQAETIAGEEHQFVRAADRLEDKINVLAARKGAMKARYVATGSRADIDHVVAELHDEMRDIDSAVRRAETRVAEINSHAAAIDRLLVSGALYDFAQSPLPIEAELGWVRGSDDVERELARIRRSL